MASRLRRKNNAKIRLSGKGFYSENRPAYINARLFSDYKGTSLYRRDRKVLDLPTSGRAVFVPED